MDRATKAKIRITGNTDMFRKVICGPEVSIDFPMMGSTIDVATNPAPSEYRHSQCATFAECIRKPPRSWLARNNKRQQQKLLRITMSWLPRWPRLQQQQSYRSYHGRAQQYSGRIQTMNQSTGKNLPTAMIPVTTTRIIIGLSRWFAIRIDPLGGSQLCGSSQQHTEQN